MAVECAGYLVMSLPTHNRNHHIADVFDTVNQSDTPTYSEYFDGTQSQAIAHFKKSRRLRDYSRPGYRIIMRTNTITLFENAQRWRWGK